MANNILVLGASGFVGSVVSEHLAGTHNVLTPSSRELDLTNHRAVTKYFADKDIDVVVNCASNMNTDLYPFNSAAATTNLMIFNNLYAVKAAYKKLINIGSGAEFDRRIAIVDAKEEDIFTKIPIDHYGLSKNIIARTVANTDNFYTLRLFGAFGPSESPSRLIKRVIAGVPVDLNDRYFDYIYIQDLLPVIQYYIDSTPKYKDVNVVYPEKYQLSSFLKQFCELHNLNEDNIKISRTPGFAYTGSADRISELKLPMLGLKQGLKDYI
jgi:GDP-L-fucose synthase